MYFDAGIIFLKEKNRYHREIFMQLMFIIKD